MKPTDEIIRRFLAGQCTEAEANKLVKQLEADPSLLESFFPRDEWEKSAAPPALPEQVIEKMYAAVDAATPKKKAATISLWYKWAAAAAIIACIAGSYWQWGRRSAENAPAAYATAIAKDSLLTAPTIIRNTTGQPLAYTLPDGSNISLAAHAVIRYEHDYNKAAREIVLEGKAYFEVAHEKDRPFTVYCEGMATTALGTSFTVEGYKGAACLQVLLHTGKVMIQSAYNSAFKMDKVYLLPGQIWSLNKHTYVYSISDRNKNHKPGLDTIPQVATLHFDRTALHDVFDELSRQYHTSILYNKAALRGLHFSGALHTSDGLEQILILITGMHELTLSKTNKGYEVGMQE